MSGDVEASYMLLADAALDHVAPFSLFFVDSSCDGRTWREKPRAIDAYAMATLLR